MSDTHAARIIIRGFGATQPREFHAAEPEL